MVRDHACVVNTKEIWVKLVGLAARSFGAGRGSGEKRGAYLWRGKGGGKPAWRTSVEGPHTGERYGFANLALLFAFPEGKTRELAQREVQPIDIP